MLYDPEKEDAQDGKWKPCLSFVETSAKLVINKTRGQQLKQLAQSPLLKAWATVGQIALRVGVFNGKAQIGIERVPNSDENALDDINKELFGF